MNWWESLYVKVWVWYLTRQINRGSKRLERLLREAKQTQTQLEDSDRWEPIKIE